MLNLGYAQSRDAGERIHAQSKAPVIFNLALAFVNSVNRNYYRTRYSAIITYKGVRMHKMELERASGGRGVEVKVGEA
jgi:hypothetical protein